MVEDVELVSCDAEHDYAEAYRDDEPALVGGHSPSTSSRLAAQNRRSSSAISSEQGLHHGSPSTMVGWPSMSSEQQMHAPLFGSLFMMPPRCVG